MLSSSYLNGLPLLKAKVSSDHDCYIAIFRRRPPFGRIGSEGLSGWAKAIKFPDVGPLGWGKAYEHSIFNNEFLLIIDTTARLRDSLHTPFGVFTLYTEFACCGDRLFRIPRVQGADARYSCGCILPPHLIYVSSLNKLGSNVRFMNLCAMNRGDLYPFKPSSKS